MFAKDRFLFFFLCCTSLCLGIELTIWTRVYLMDVVCLLLGPMILFYLKRYSTGVITYFVFGFLTLSLFFFFDTQHGLERFDIIKGASRNFGFYFAIVIGFVATAKFGLKRTVMFVVLLSVSFALFNLYVHQSLGYPLRHSFKYGGGYFVLNFVSILLPHYMMSATMYFLLLPFLGIYYQYRGILLIGVVTGIFPIMGKFFGVRKGPLIFGFIAVFAGLVLFGGYNYLKYQSMISGSMKRDNASTEARLNMIVDASNQFIESPFVGNGSYSQSYRHFDALDSSYFTGVHSVFFQLLAEYGFLGGIVSILYFLGPIVLVFINRLDVLIQKDFLGRVSYAYIFLLVFSGYGFFMTPITGFLRNIFGLTIGTAVGILANENLIHNKFSKRWRR